MCPAQEVSELPVPASWGGTVPSSLDTHSWQQPQQDRGSVAL